MVDLRLSCAVHGKALEVKYELGNQGKVPLIAFDGATGKGEPLPDITDAVYVGAAGGEVRILRVVPSPGTLAVDALPIPNVSETQPGQTRTVNFTLPLPLRERSEFTPDFPQATYEERAVHSLSLVIGYFWKTPNTVLKPFPDNPAVFRLESKLPQQQRAQASVRIIVPVLMRTDSNFARPE